MVEKQFRTTKPQGLPGSFQEVQISSKQGNHVTSYVQRPTHLFPDFLLLLLFGKHVVINVDHLGLALKLQGSYTNPFLSFHDTAYIVYKTKKKTIKIGICIHQDEPGSTATTNDSRNEAIETTKFISSLCPLCTFSSWDPPPPRQEPRLMKHPLPGGLPDTQADNHHQESPTDC